MFLGDGSGPQGFGPFSFLRNIFKNPLTLFVYGLLSKWYIIFIGASLVVTFWVFQGLKEAGIIAASEKILIKSLNDTKSIAQNCIPKIKNIKVFWECLQNPPEYRPKSEAEKQLQKQIDNAIKSENK